MLLHLNDDWLFYSSLDSKEPVNVRLPHNNVEMPFHYFDESVYQKISKYEKMIDIKKSWKDKTLLITFLAVAHQSQIYVNDKYIYTHKCGYTAFTLDISKYVEYGASNKITVIADSNETLNQPPFGNVIDYMTYGGMYREVYLEIKEKTYIKDVHVIGRAKQASGYSPFTAHIQISTEQGNFEYDVDVAIASLLDNKRIFEETYTTKESLLTLTEKVLGVKNWDIVDPNLYSITVRLYLDETLLDEYTDIFGFRDAEFKKDGFYLNSKRVQITGLNRHQSYPYIGYALPKRVQRNDADILKFELNLNAVRTSHYPQSKDFVRHCDEIGLLVFTEMPGWQHIGDDAWQDIAVENTKQMVIQYRNHPSVILWGVRINESPDDDSFYERTNREARKLDPYRPTGGVRNIKKSSFFEDVYTYNDFTHNGGKRVIAKKQQVTKKDTPYLVTEYNGHMFPAKMFDDEPHRVEHALRHARVLNAVMKDKGIAGSFGWCMNDYNTHKDFGSGDRICYHGVMDMFRNPKDAAYVYASQTDTYPVMHVCSSMAKGDYPMSMTKSIWAFTNCDYIRMSVNGRHIKDFYPDKKGFPHMIHPPVEIDDFTGNLLKEDLGFSDYSSKTIKRLLKYIYINGPDNLPLHHLLSMATVLLREKLTTNKLVEIVTAHVAGWGDLVKQYMFEGVKDGKVVVTEVLEPPTNISISATSDTYELKEENTYDVASVRIRMVDQNNNLLNYCNEPLRLVAQGPIKIIGPDNISLKGGCAGVYIKTDKRSGKGILKIIGTCCEREVIFHVQCEKDRELY